MFPIRLMLVFLGGSLSCQINSRNESVRVIGVDQLGNRISFRIDAIEQVATPGSDFVELTNKRGYDLQHEYVLTAQRRYRFRGRLSNLQHTPFSQEAQVVSPNELVILKLPGVGTPDIDGSRLPRANRLAIHSKFCSPSDRELWLEVREFPVGGLNRRVAVKKCQVDFGMLPEITYTVLLYDGLKIKAVGELGTVGGLTLSLHRVELQ